MVSAEDFSSVEWAIVTELPVRVVAAAMAVEPSSGLGAILEEITGITQLSQGATQRPDSKLVQEVFAGYKADGAGEEQALQMSQQWVENLVPETLVRARQVTELLSGRVDDSELDAFRDWLLETAAAICASAKSGGTILGIGGKRISDAEEAFLHDLEAALTPLAGKVEPESGTPATQP
jgi:hypothetical protein